MNDCFLIVDASSQFDFGALTKHRVPAAIPFLSKYRFIDVPLSLSRNSSIVNVGVFCDRNYRSLQDHIASGDRYNLNRRRDGIFLLPPKVLNPSNETYLSFERMAEQSEYFKRSSQEYCIITPSTLIWGADLNVLLEKHIQTKKDISQVVLENGERLYTFILKKERLMHYIKSYSTISFRNIVEVFDYSNLETKNNIIYSEYAKYVRSTKEYYDLQMSFLNEDSYNLKELLSSFCSKEPLDSSAYFSLDSSVKKSFVATGSYIEGEVYNSIISRRTIIEKGAKIYNSILLNNTVVKKNAIIENAILDKETIVLENAKVVGTNDEPFVSEKKQLVHSSILPKVAILTMECIPFIKRGGLADMVGSLSLELSKIGADVHVFLPLFQEIKQKYQNKLEKKNELILNIESHEYHINVYQAENEKLTYHFIDLYMFFDRKEIYGYKDDPYRFAYFTYAVMEYLNQSKIKIDVFHYHDWHTALLPLFKKKYPKFKDSLSILTIHNLNYQGEASKDIIEEFNLDYQVSGGIFNFLEAGIELSDEITTVSKTYADELQYSFYSNNLKDSIYRRRSNLYGIVNGLDSSVSPMNDLEIKAQYDIDSFKEKKIINKRFLMEHCGFEINDDAFIMSSVSRINEIKGFDLIIDSLYGLLENPNIYFVLLGVGDDKIMSSLKEIERRYPKQVKLFLDFYGTIPSYIYSGADIFLMPSKIEPCGTSQMIALKYGTIPIVRQTGGLNDTIQTFDPSTKIGNGFKFANIDSRELINIINHSYSIFKNQKDTWMSLIENAMKCDFSFERCAKQYLNLYNKKER